MRRADAFVVGGIVIECLAPALVRVELRNGHRLLAHVARREQALAERLAFQLGDRVTVMVSPFDLSVGRLILQERQA